MAFSCVKFETTVSWLRLKVQWLNNLRFDAVNGVTVRTSDLDTVILMCLEIVIMMVRCCLKAL